MSTVLVAFLIGGLAAFMMSFPRFVLAVFGLSAAAGVWSWAMGGGASFALLVGCFLQLGYVAGVGLRAVGVRPARCGDAPQGSASLSKGRTRRAPPLFIAPRP